MKLILTEQQAKDLIGSIGQSNSLGDFDIEKEAPTLSKFIKTTRFKQFSISGTGTVIFPIPHKLIPSVNNLTSSTPFVLQTFTFVLGSLLIVMLSKFMTDIFVNPKFWSVLTITNLLIIGLDQNIDNPCAVDSLIEK